MQADDEGEQHEALAWTRHRHKQADLEGRACSPTPLEGAYEAAEAEGGEASRSH